MPCWVNRKTRVRHADPNCRSIRLSARYLDDEANTASKRDGRIVELPDPETDDERAAVDAFTCPCVHCYPGARKLWDSLSVDFEQTYEYDE